MPGSACMAGDWHQREASIPPDRPGDPGGRRELLARHLLVFCPTAQLQLGAARCECVIHSFLPASLPVWANSTPAHTKGTGRAQEHRRHAAPFSPYPDASRALRFPMIPVSPDVLHLTPFALDLTRHAVLLFLLALLTDMLADLHWLRQPRGQ